MLLIGVVVEQKVTAGKHIEYEYKPVTMFYEEIQQFFHLFIERGRRIINKIRTRRQ